MALLRFSMTVGGWTMVSRVAGFARDMLIAGFLAAGPVADAFFVAFRLPNMFRRLVGEGALVSAFVPLYARRLEEGGEAQARRFAEEAMSVLVYGLFAALVLAEMAMPWLVKLIAPGFDDPAQEALTVEFARLCFPYLLFMAVVALLGGILNAHYRFAAPAAAPVLLNIVLIAAILLLTPYLPTAGHALSWGVAAAGAGQFLWLVFACHRAGIRLALPRPRLTQGVRRLLRLVAPGLLGAGVHQINLLVSTMVATFQAGAVSFLYYADRVNQLPLGVIGVAVGVALLPMLSRQLRTGREEDALGSQNRAIELAMLLTLPAAVALVLVPGPIIATLFERGAFDAADTAATAAALAAFSAGLPAYVLVKVLAPGFFAREDMKTPVYIAAASLSANAVLSVALFFPFGHVGIAAATAIASWLNAGLLALVLRRRGHLAADARMRRALPRIVVAAVVMGAGLFLLAWALAPWFAGGQGARVAGLCLLVFSALALYGVLAWGLKAMTPAELRVLMRRPAGVDRPPAESP